MAEHSTIEWTDATWNPITGCSVVSPGCTNCYAMGLAGTRLQHHPSRAGLTRSTKAGPVWTGEVRLNEAWLAQPLQWKRPRRIFVCAHGDLFAEGVPDEWIDRVFAAMALAPQHTYQVLTKRADRMRAYLSNPGREHAVGSAAMDAVPAGRDIRSATLCWTPRKGNGSLDFNGRWPLPNVWLGVSVEDQRRADERIPDLLATPAAVRWISAEPLLGPVTLSAIPVPGDDGRHMHALYGHEHAGMVGQCVDWTPPLDWVVVGGESGPSARPMHPDWARSLRDQCAAAGTPYLFKQWGAFAPVHELRASDPGIAGRLWHNFDPDTSVFRIGKAAAGRLLDGVHHDGMPAVGHG